MVIVVSDKHWTDKHIIKCDNLNLWIAFDEAGLPYSVHNTEEEAQDALIMYGIQLQRIMPV